MATGWEGQGGICPRQHFVGGDTSDSVFLNSSFDGLQEF